MLWIIINAAFLSIMIIAFDRSGRFEHKARQAMIVAAAVAIVGAFFTLALPPGGLQWIAPIAQVLCLYYLLERYCEMSKRHSMIITVSYLVFGLFVSLLFNAV